jgi:hypothetical protein
MIQYLKNKYLKYKVLKQLRNQLGGISLKSEFVCFSCKHVFPRNLRVIDSDLIPYCVGCYEDNKRQLYG